MFSTREPSNRRPPSLAPNQRQNWRKKSSNLPQHYPSPDLARPPDRCDVVPNREEHHLIQILGLRPSDPEKALRVAKTALKRASLLIPIFNHCYIPCNPCLAGNPIFYVDENWIFCYDLDLSDFFEREPLFRKSETDPYVFKKQRSHCHNLVVDRQCKIRKRDGGSFSSSSSLVRRYRLKRAILVGKRGGSSTPVLTWKTLSAAAVVEGSPCTATMVANGDEDDQKIAKLQQRRLATEHGGRGGGKGKEVVSVSARKLAATLWEMNEQEQVPLRKKDSKVAQVPSLAGSLPPKSSDPSSTSIYERKNESGGGGRQRRLSVISQKHHLNDYQMGGFERPTSASLTEVKYQSCGKPDRKCIHGFKTGLKDVSSGLSTSKELVKVLTRVSGLEEQHSLTTTLLSALRVELDRARVQVHQLIREQRSNCNEIEFLMKKFTEDSSGGFLKKTWFNVAYSYKYHKMQNGHGHVQASPIADKVVFSKDWAVVVELLPLHFRHGCCL
ncbi:hypothetical protein ACFXTO_023315 [Malus domestica]